MLDCLLRAISDPPARTQAAAASSGRRYEPCPVPGPAAGRNHLGRTGQCGTHQDTVLAPVQAQPPALGTHSLSPC